MDINTDNVNNKKKDSYNSKFSRTNQDNIFVRGRSQNLAKNSIKLKKENKFDTQQEDQDKNSDIIRDFNDIVNKVPRNRYSLIHSNTSKPNFR